MSEKINESSLNALKIAFTYMPRSIEVTKYEYGDSYQKVLEAITKIEKEVGSIDILVNNAGINLSPAPLIDMDLEAFRHIYDVNLYGTLNAIQVFGKLFQDQGTPAAIYNLGSENSIYPCVPSSHAYVSSKHAILAITELLAEETPDFIDKIGPELATDLASDIQRIWDKLNG